MKREKYQHGLILESLFSYWKNITSANIFFCSLDYFCFSFPLTPVIKLSIPQLCLQLKLCAVVLVLRQWKWILVGEAKTGLLKVFARLTTKSFIFLPDHFLLVCPFKLLITLLWQNSHVCSTNHSFDTRACKIPFANYFILRLAHNIMHWWKTTIINYCIYSKITISNYCSETEFHSAIFGTCSSSKQGSFSGVLLCLHLNESM